MLPFLVKTKKQDAGVITEHRPSDHEPEGHDEAMDAAAKDVLDAVSSNDIKRLSKALHAAFEIYDSMPHEEGPHTNDDDSDEE